MKIINSQASVLVENDPIKKIEKMRSCVLQVRG